LKVRVGEDGWERMWQRGRQEAGKERKRKENNRGEE